MALKKPIVEVTEMDDSESNLSSSNDEFQSGDSEMSDGEKNISGNLGWADAMSKLLNASVKQEKFILSKAKKDSDIKPKEEKEIEVVDDSGKVKNASKEKKTVKSYKQQRKEMLEKQKKKVFWESMCRVKPDITQREKERELLRIATRGVVHLFNTVQEYQKNAKINKGKLTKEREKLNVIKGNFMDILKGHAKEDKSIKVDPIREKVKEEETWSILKDDFMMGAEMKDWDKESNED